MYRQLFLENPGIQNPGIFDSIFSMELNTLSIQTKGSRFGHFWSIQKKYFSLKKNKNEDNNLPWRS